MTARLPIRVRIVIRQQSVGLLPDFFGGPDRHGGGRMAEDAYILAAAGIVAALVAVYAYTALSAPKGLFRTPREHVEIKAFRRKQGK